MKSRLFFLFSLLVSFFSAPFTALAEDDGLVHDVLVVDDFNTTHKNQKTIDQQWQVSKEGVVYKGKTPIAAAISGYEWERFFVLSYQGTLDNPYVFNASSRGYIRSITLTLYGGMTQNAAELNVYVSNTPFVESDMGIGTEVSHSTLLDKKLTKTELTIDITEDYKYVCLRPNTSTFHIASIDFGWEINDEAPEDEPVPPHPDNVCALKTGCIHNGVFYRMDLNPNEYKTLCLPRDVAAEDLDGITPFTISYKVDAGDNDHYTVYYTREFSIKAGEPYVFSTSKSEIALKLSGDEVNTGRSHNGLHGTLTNLYPFSSYFPNYTSGEYSIIHKNQILPASGASGVGPYRCYFVYSEFPDITVVASGSTAPPAAFVMPGMADMLTGLEAPRTTASPNLFPVYDITGRSIADPHGLVIRNGRKTIVR